MPPSPKDIDIINIMLGEEGVIKYNAIKNRFIMSEPDNVFKNNNFLHMYRENSAVVPDNTITSYRTNLQRLRRKIEECKVRITEVTTPLNSTAVTQVTQTQAVRTEEVIVMVTPNGSQTPVVEAPKGAEQSKTPAVSAYPVSQANSLDQFKNATIQGPAILHLNKQLKSGIIKLEGTVLEGSVRTKKGAGELAASIDLSTAKLFLLVRKKRRFLFCFRQPLAYVPLGKEIELINLAKPKQNEILLKNTNTGSFTKEITEHLEFALKDKYNQMHTYRIEDSDEFFKWLLIMKLRMHPVDRWNKTELIESIQK